MPRQNWSGRRVTNAIAFVVARDAGICQLCQHPGANSLDHIQHTDLRPDLEWEPTNWQAVHLQRAGKPKGCTVDGCTCIGNYGKAQGSNTAAIEASRRGTPPPPSRAW